MRRSRASATPLTNDSESKGKPSPARAEIELPSTGGLTSKISRCQIQRKISPRRRTSCCFSKLGFSLRLISAIRGHFGISMGDIDSGHASTLPLDLLQERIHRSLSLGFWFARFWRRRSESSASELKSCKSKQLTSVRISLKGILGK
jgi:hypothetical protein